MNYIGMFLKYLATLIYVGMSEKIITKMNDINLGLECYIFTKFSQIMYLINTDILTCLHATCD